MFQFPDKMLKVFKDDKIQADFEKNGYVILPFYTPEEIAELEALYFKMHPEEDLGFFPSTFSSDHEYRKVADSEIRRICQKHIEHYCQNFRVMNGAFIVKTPSPKSGMCVHQDMSLVDESKYTGINIWVPLTDLTIENGALFVLPGSHRLFPTYRGSSIPEFFSPVMNEIIDYLQPVLIKAGQAVFFDQSIIHFSPPNFSDRPRIVTNTYFTHQDTEFRTYYWDGETPNKIEVFEQDKDFMLNFEQFGANIRDRPKIGKSLGLVDYDFPKIDIQFLNTHFEKSNARALIENVAPKKEEVSSSSDSLKWYQKLFKVFAS
ncbi:MAG: phytanoyl-CoA dioxygenase family protein [Chitinophagales bacterium]|nr:phytanoyl-CoA dioxygenase family protein [Chitinophagales bacterium]